jgi:hypothetical protein
MRAKTILLNPQTCFILLLGAQQTTSFNVDHWYTASIGFATPGDYACGVIESRPEQVWLSLTSNITSSGCYNLADVFTEPSCNPNEPTCLVPFTTHARENFTAAANYSRAVYTFAQPLPHTASSVNATELTLSVFDGEDCVEREYPPYQWSGCEDDVQECTDLPFSVASFYITGSEDANRTGTCLVGEVQGSASQASVLSGVVMGVAVMIGVVLM